MVEQSKTFQVAEIDKAINQKFSFFNSSAAEKLAQFLLLNNRKHVLAQIKHAMLQTNPFEEVALTQDIEARLRLEEKQAFLKAVLDTSRVIFKLPVLSIGVSADDEPEPMVDYKVRLKKYYEDQGFINDLKLMREYKKLVSELFRSFGYKAPAYTLFSKDRYEDVKQFIKQFNLEDSDTSLDALVDFAAESENQYEDGFVRPYEYNLSSYNFKALDQEDQAKLKLQRLKSILLGFSVFAGLMLGLGEAFAPAKFYLALFTSLGLSGIGFPLAATAFFAAILVNFLLMQGAVYETFKDLLFKRRLTRDANGNKLSIGQKVLNVSLLGLSVFAALTIAGLSFAFSGFGVVPAGFISLMTFVCFKSLLANSVMKLTEQNFKKVRSGFEYFIGNFVEPFKLLKENRFNIFNKAGRSIVFKLLVNSTATVATLGLCASVVAASFVMFSSALSGIPLLISLFGSSAPLAAMGIVTLAEFTLGTFFVQNVATFVDVLRQAVLGLPSTLTAAKQAVLDPKPAKVESVNDQIEPGLRTVRVAVGRVVGFMLASFAFLNAGGFGFGYKALFRNPFKGIAAAVSYVMSSVAGNAGPALNMALAGPGFYNVHSSCLALEKYQAAAPYRVGVESSTIPNEAASGLTGFDSSSSCTVTPLYHSRGRDTSMLSPVVSSTLASEHAHEMSLDSSDTKSKR